MLRVFKRFGLAGDHAQGGDRTTNRGSEGTPPAVEMVELANPPVSEEDTGGPPNLPRGWKYRMFGFRGFALPWFASPRVQLTMVSFVCFLCPGMFNALSALGGAGRHDPTLADKMNTALYSTFAVFGFFGGTIVNTIGVKLTLAFGSIGYGIYAIALLVSLHHHVDAFNVFAGALLGVCAGLLWTAQGTIMLSYPNEDEKGKYFAWFWGIFNLGGVIGSLVPLGENIHTKTNENVSTGTYIAFIVLMFTGALLASMLCNVKDVIRKDLSRVIVVRNPTWKTEFWAMYEALHYEPYVVLLFPMFWASNWFYTYQQNDVNGVRFNTRTKALNDLLYWLFQIFGAVVVGYSLDWRRFSRATRAKAAFVGLFILTMIVWGPGYAFAKSFSRADASSPAFRAIDWTDGAEYFGPMFLFAFYGFYDAAWQACVYWFMGALSNSGRRSANYVGFYKGIQSAGAAVMWSMDAHKTPFLTLFLSNWIVLSTAVGFAFPVIFFKIRNTVHIEDDVAGTGEQAEYYLPGHGDSATAQQTDAGVDLRHQNQHREAKTGCSSV